MRDTFLSNCELCLKEVIFWGLESLLMPNVRVYDPLRCKSDYLSNYTKILKGTDLVANNKPAMGYTRCCGQ